jgi:Type II secretion system (T2SS), protein F
MFIMTALAGLAGGLAVAGLTLLIRELAVRVAQQRLSRPARWSMSQRTRRRALGAAVTGIAVFVVTGWPVAMVAAAAAVLFLPQITSTKTARRRVAVLEGLEQWTRRLSDMLTASRALEDAIEASVMSAPAAIAPAVSNLGRRLAARAGAEAALRGFAAEIDDPAGDRIAAALIIATGRRGGAVRDVLNALAVMLARDVAARREVEADRAQHRTTVKWLTAFVVGFTAFAALDRSYAAPYGTVSGQFVLALIGVLYAGGLSWLHYLGSAPVPGRFLLQDRQFEIPDGHRAPNSEMTVR